MTRFDSALDVPEINTPTDTPSSGRKRLYVKTDGVYMQDSAGSETLVGGTIMSNVPVGTVLAYGGAVVPAGFLLSDGSAVSRAAYSDLFAVIGTTYGAGDGSTTFNLPNFIGRHPMGRYPGGGYASSLGVMGGESEHVLTIGEMPSHVHGQAVLANGAAGTGQRIDFAGDRAFAGRFPQGTDTDAAGGSGAHNVLDPYTTVNFIIRAVPSALVDTSTIQFFKGAVAANAAVAMAANTNMPFTVRTDPSNAWNATNNNWVCPQPGRYRIAVAWKANATAAARSVRILKNGTAIAQGPLEANAASAGGYFEDVLDLVPGDTISVQPTVLYTTMQDGAGIENNWLIIESVGLAGAPATGWSDTGWINMQLQNSWVNYDSGLSIGGSGRTAQYRKINGIVYCRGVIKSGTSGTAFTVMPAGFRPGHRTTVEKNWVTNGNNSYATLGLDGNTGNFQAAGAGVSSFVYLDAAFWPAEQ